MKATRIILAALVAVSFVPAANAQATLEDVRGRIGLLIPGLLPTFSLNTGDASANLSASYVVNDDKLVYGGNLKAKSTDGIGPIIGSGDINPGVGGRLFVGWKSSQFILAGIHQHDWSSTPVIEQAATAATIKKPTSVTWETGGRAQWINAKAKLPFAANVSAGGRRVNDYSELPKGSLRRIVRFTDPATGAESEVVRTDDGRIGAITPERLGYADVDVLVAPTFLDGITFRAFGRGLYSRPDDSKQRNSLGIDLGVYKKGTDPIFGRTAAIVLQLDEARPGDDATNLRKRLSVAIVADLGPVFGLK